MSCTDTVFGDLPILETDRLVLRKLGEDDAADIFEYASDPEVTKYLIWQAHKSIDDSRAFVKFALDRYLKLEVAPWGILHKQDNRIIGTCDYISWIAPHGRAEIGYAMSRPYWGRGLMTEAVREIIGYGFREKHLNRIQAVCDVPNIGSARVLEKVGMNFEGILRKYIHQHNGFHDVKMYAVLREDWKRSQ